VGVVEKVFTMTRHFNKTSEKEKRRHLRRKQTLAEEIVWQNVRNRKMLGYKFRRQYSVDYFVIDFYCPELKLALEIDGSVHNSEEAKKYDREREKYIEQFGIKFLRITNAEVLGNSNRAFAKIEERIKKLVKSDGENL